MRYLSVCSGIEAASCAWHPLGWEPFAFSEIEPFPASVLAHHYPNVPNLGDMTKFKDWPDAAIDVLVGGTPCQSFSVAGLRKGLDDPRGNLMLTYLAIADRYRPTWVVWENVPGVLSIDGGRAFGTLLGGLGQLGYGFAYRVLDAQHIRVQSHARAVPQRRRRVFVVGYFGDWRRAAAVLLERESLRGHPAPRREAGKVATGSLAARTRGGGGLGTDFDCDGGLIPDRSMCLNAGGMGRSDSETETLIPTIGGGFDVAPIDMRQASRGDKITNNRAHGSGGAPGHGVGDFGDPAFTVSERGQAVAMDVAHSLRGEGFDASEDGTGRGTPLVPVGVTIHGTDKTVSVASFTDVAGALRARTPGGQENSSTTAVLGFAQNQRDEVRLMDAAGALAAEPGMKQQTYVATHDVAGTMMSYTKSGGDSNRIDNAASGYMALAPTMQVRRLTPLECERLQGFPDGYTDIGRADGPRYKALGNSMAVNVMSFIGRRIELVRRLTP